MRTGEFHYTARPLCTPGEAMALLSDLTRQGELHPLIVAVTPEAPRPGAIRSYTITDVLRWGPLVSFRIVYQADILAESATELDTVARQSPNVTVRNRTTVTPEAAGTRIDCHVTLTAPTPLFRYVFTQARRAHTELAARMETALGPGGHRTE